MINANLHCFCLSSLPRPLPKKIDANFSLHCFGGCSNNLKLGQDNVGPPKYIPVLLRVSVVLLYGLLTLGGQ